MLTTNTGEALCDSGGIYGRHHEKNAKRSLKDFENDPAVTIDAEDASNSEEVQYTISLFHYLTKSLLIDAICDDFNSLKCKEWNSDIYGISESQKDLLLSNGFEVKDSFNSYNGESNLSQVIQGTYLKNGTDTYILLQIHQGCDVRGGYTDAKLFLLSDDCLAPESVYGDIDGVNVDNRYNGNTLTDEDGKPVPVTPKSVISLELMEY